MKISSKSVLENLSNLRARFPGNSRTQKYADNEPPLRSELFSSDQMDQHGKVLAGSHKLSTDHVPETLLTRLAENEGVLLEEIGRAHV